MGAGDVASRQGGQQAGWPAHPQQHQDHADAAEASRVVTGPPDRPDPTKPFAQVRAGELRLTTHLESGRSIEDATIKAKNIDGFLHIEITAPEDRIVGYAVSVNGRPVPRDDA